MQEVFEGFIVHAYPGRGARTPRLYLTGRLRDGHTFAVVEERERPGFYLRSSDLSPAFDCIGQTGGRWEECGLRTIDGEPCSRVSLPSTQRSQQALQCLAERGIRTYEGDIRFTDQFLMSKGIHGSLKIKGSFQKGRRVDRIFINPDIEPSTWHPSLSVLSLDIETDPKGERIYAMGLAFSDPWAGMEIQEVLFAGPIEGSRGPIEANDEITVCPDERSMLLGFCKRVTDLDPDIITGWNVIDFDFKIIAERMSCHRLPMKIGRSDDPAAYLQGQKGRSDTVFLPGRQVLDAVRIVRAAPERFSDYSLETVAKAILGRGKSLELRENESRLKAISRLYREDPVSLCLYCKDDARLVLEILARTGLMELTLRRCLLIGISLDRAWTSIPAFDYIYIEALHLRGFAAPSPGVDPMPTIEAEGGAILEPQTGLYDNVWVFDFKSLYPSIIRTFNIDPLSFVLPDLVKEMAAEKQASLIRAPNGACFRRDAAIIPELLERFFESRSEAKNRGDDIASYVYKIIMNTFYGVLGADGSRFASGYLSGAITSFGHHVLHWCVHYLTRLCYRVLYGDTDSLFVLSGLPQGSHREELIAKSSELCAHINRDLSLYIESTYGVKCFLELEFEKVYHRFFLPPVRSGAALDGGPSRGRAKGYAGLLVPVSELDEPDRHEGKSGSIEIVGMEAVRRDWTDLAQGFQIGLLELIFRGEKLDTVLAFTKKLITKLYRGELDDRLVYRKALRKPIAGYTRSRPPHVRAASMLDPEEQRGLIHYLWTLEGPQPVGRLTSPIDYEHYLEKQLKPIAQSFTEVLHTDLAHIFGDEEQLKLF